MMTLKQSLYNHFVGAYSLLLGICVTILILYWFNFEQGAVIIFGIFLAVDALPAIYQHIEYFLQNRREIYRVRNNSITLYCSESKKTYHIKELQKITFYMTPSRYKGSNFHLWAIE